MAEQLVGRVVKVLHEDHLVANLGLAAGVQPGDRFVVFELGEDITDPETGESLGRLEQVKCEAEVIHVQERLVQLRPIDEGGEAPAAPQVLSAALASTARHTDPRLRRRARIAVGDHVRRVTLREGEAL